MNKNKCDLDVMCGMYKMPLDSKWSDSVKAYHITRKANIGSIKENGLKAQRCDAVRNADSRRSAVYLFAAKADAYDKNIRSFLFGAETDLLVLEIRIPASGFQNMIEDGLFNASCICSDNSYPFGIQYTADIPADWIVG